MVYIYAEPMLLEPIVAAESSAEVYYLGIQTAGGSLEWSIYRTRTAMTR